MNTHITDDELVLHFYGEAADEADRVDAHLSSCTGCRENWAALQRTLKMVDAVEVPEPPDGFERVMWARVQQHLPDARAARTVWWSPRFLAPIAGLAAVIAMAFMAGRMWTNAADSGTGSSVPAASAAAADERAIRERVLLSAVGEHFEQTEMLLVELKNRPETTKVDLSYEQQTARDLVAAGRLYRETAKQNGDAQLGAMLEDLERVLVDVAGSPSHMNSKDLKALRARIEEDSLLFKVRALTNAVRDREKTLSTIRSARTL
jgi:hypothetical protein